MSDLTNQKTLHIVWWLTAWTLIVLSSLFVRNYIPVDETRYVSVAWEMWTRGDFLLPTLNGAPYSHKPPLMFWLFQLGWALFGVNEWWPRILPALFALASLFMTGLLAKQLWPNHKEISWQAPTILLGCLFWAFYTPTTMFDMILAFFVLLAIYGLVLAAKQKKSGWYWFILAVGLGILAKGPVALLQFTFPALLAPLWVSDKSGFSYKKWYSRLFLCILIGALIPLLWAIPAAIKGGSAYSNEIFLSQTVNRVQQSFAHQRPWYWYLPLLPVLLMPWFIWPSFWKKAIHIKNYWNDNGIRLVLLWLIPTFLSFCFISGKQIHYLIPMFPAFALLTARLLCQQLHFPRKNQLPILLVAITASILLAAMPFGSAYFSNIPDWVSAISPWWGLPGLAIGISLLFIKELNNNNVYIILSAISVMMVLITLFGVVRVMNPTYDLKPIATRIGEIERSGKAIVHVGNYHNQYQFLSRLEKPLPIILNCEKRQWAKDHADGWLIDYVKPNTFLSIEPEFIQPYRGKIAILWQSQQLLQLDEKYPFPSCEKNS